jgi:hypothetical protein
MYVSSAHPCALQPDGVDCDSCLQRGGRGLRKTREDLGVDSDPVYKVEVEVDRTRPGHKSMLTDSARHCTAPASLRMSLRSPDRSVMPGSLAST